MFRSQRIVPPHRQTPEWGKLMWRGCTKRCPRCGGRRIYDTWFRMKDRCPTCGFQFEREEGFFVGAYLINFAIAEGLLFVVIMGFVAWKSQNPDGGVAVVLALTLVLAILGPVVMYPFSRTIWSAIDLGMTPLSAAEEASAINALAAVGKTWGDPRAEVVPGGASPQADPGDPNDPDDPDQDEPKRAE